MSSIQTGYTERKLSSVFVNEVVEIATARAEAEGTNPKTLSRHKYAITSSVEVLGVARSKITKPGVWAALYLKDEVTSTVISNMKFIASILEWAAESGRYDDATHYAKIARAIRLALAVRG